MNRRALLGGCAALLLDRAVPVRVIRPEDLLRERMNEIYAITRANMARLVFETADNSLGLGRLLEAA